MAKKKNEKRLVELEELLKKLMDEKIKDIVEQTVTETMRILNVYVEPKHEQNPFSV